MKMAIERILVGDRLRPMHQPTVDLYAEAMGHVATSTSRSPSGRSEPVGACDHRLVAGGHRLAAAKQISWSRHRGHVKHYASDDAARLAEISENLIRAELSPLDRAIHLAELKAVFERLHPTAGRGGDRRSAERLDAIKRQSLPFRFSRDAAATIGLSDRTIRDAVQIVGAIGGDVADLLRRAPVALNGARAPERWRSCRRAERSDRRRSIEATGAPGRSTRRSPGWVAASRPSTGRSSSTGRWSRCGAGRTPKTRKRIVAHVEREGRRMLRSAPRRTAQDDLFDYADLYPVRAPQEALRPVDLSLRIKTAMGRALKECPDSATIVAAKMSEWTGRPITADALYAYTAPSKPDHDMGIMRFVAFVRATGATWLWGVLLADDGLIGA